jgi:cysteinyl-tRNA synthetase
MTELKVHNSLTRQKEIFKPITPGHVGMYVCGPTVSGESHLGHARPYITFDVIYRYMGHLGYKVRYVRNITDAGHFEEEGREAEDKISKKAVLGKAGTHGTGAEIYKPLSLGYGPIQLLTSIHRANGNRAYRRTDKHDRKDHC